MHSHQISWFVFLNILSWKPQFVRRRSWPGLKFLHWRFLSFILLPSNHNSSHDWNDHQLIIFDKGFITSLISNDIQETNGHQRGKLTRLRKKYLALLDMWVIYYLFINLKYWSCTGTISLRRIARTEAIAAAVRTTIIVRSGVITICKMVNFVKYSWLFVQKWLLSDCSFVMFFNLIYVLSDHFW